MSPQLSEDEEAAVLHAATRFLISAADAGDVVTVARRIHAASVRGAFPFVHLSAAALPTDATAFGEACANLLDAASGGTLLLTHVEDMPTIVQRSLIETLAALQGARDPLATVRLVAGTTALLRDHIADGTFSEHLFYRLNVIHIVIAVCPATRESSNVAMRRFRQAPGRTRH
jgi:DNA-binding NtrC family response regulator